MTQRIAFILNGEARTLPAETPPGTTLLDWLRAAGLTGTKEGCAEGDCGACTVVLEEADGGRTPVNACLAVLGQMQGRAIRTVEGLSRPGAPHPVQLAMAEGDATQCGFCTPGIVMSAWAHAREGGAAHEALAGNLCRCTGYRPILSVFEGVRDDGAAPPALPPLTSAELASPDQVFHAPVTLAEALALRAAHPEAWLLAGGTDLGLRFAGHREKPARILGLGAVAELRALEIGEASLRIGAGLPYGALLRALRGLPDLAPLAGLLARLGSRQIRGMGTLGGNLGTASPIGDALPPLLALGATVEVQSAAHGARSLPVAEFLTGYRRTALAADEIITAIGLPRPPPGALFACEKLSKRHDQDISTVSAAFLLELEEGRIRQARLAFGGMAATVVRAAGAEAALTGAPLAEASFAAAAQALAGDVTPLSDGRGSAEYRLRGAQGLLMRLFWRATRPELALEVQA
ncbi:xanthine dehydrogenase small subunit [Pseudoroseomonas cervicalis]|uniref:Putative xanthine dehydrogenase, small subunit n=1 Tax=Pseudoroseomonas cervicalis ATCC 49957 TaxID=525371 RepID=D5RTK2_9PROT|nr:FAD binding domain-containing protein [Pseudoroseomonas cervicalis]EFH09367.1 putative xanthine dehydrogenase, small subunit [Pseudoroseomonas cervicalis ATCC 49957]